MTNKVIRKIYRTLIRERLPHKHRLLAGVAVCDVPLLDKPEHEKNYKEGFLSAISENIKSGDRVELVGLGRGVSSTYVLDAGAAKLTAYEAAEEMIEIGQKTLNQNRPFKKDIHIRHALIGESIKIYGNSTNAEVISPEEIPKTDVLVLDCEGSEKSIIKGLDELPAKIICETHPERGVPTETVIEELRPEYNIHTRRYHPDKPRNKKVIVAELKS